tara:strand:- start:623 stop:772 length:150 start_codon:yes stop_codon:yes gene_type:complete
LREVVVEVLMDQIVVAPEVAVEQEVFENQCLALQLGRLVLSLTPEEHYL